MAGAPRTRTAGDTFSLVKGDVRPHPKSRNRAVGAARGHLKQPINYLPSRMDERAERGRDGSGDCDGHRRWADRPQRQGGRPPAPPGRGDARVRPRQGTDAGTAGLDVRCRPRAADVDRPRRRRGMGSAGAGGGPASHHRRAGARAPRAEPPRGAGAAGDDRAAAQLPRGTSHAARPHPAPAGQARRAGRRPGGAEAAAAPSAAARRRQHRAAGALADDRDDRLPDAVRPARRHTGRPAGDHR